MNVSFRFDRGDVIALIWPCDVNHGRIMSYAHVGQHSEADCFYRGQRAATATEYAPLLRELRSIGYELSVKKRISLEQVRKGWK